MKKIVFTAAVICFAAFATTVSAQDDKKEEKVTKKEKKDVQEIVIRKKGEKDTKIVVEIKGDDITINGKPLSEYKDDEITINRRNMIIRDGLGKTRMTFTPEDFGGLNFWNDHDGSGAFLGVTTNDMDDESKTKGAKITNVSKESAAEKAGLKNGDVITKINDKKVEGPESLSEVVTSFKPKDEVTVYYLRDGVAGSAKATLGERKSAMSYSFSGPDGNTRAFTIPRVEGVPNVDVTPRVWTPGVGGADNFEFFNDNTFSFPRQQKLGLKIQDTDNDNGVKVLEVDKDSPVDKAGLKKDDIVTEIGGKKVTNTDEVREQLHQNMEKSTYNIKATRNGNTMSFDIKIEKKLKTANL
jgi:serine protease Do